MSGIVTQNLNTQSGLVKAPEASGGAWTFISKTTASASATISITSGLDSTYKEYLFTFKNIHPASGGYFLFNGSTDSGSNYNVNATSTWFVAGHQENGTNGALSYDGGNDVANGTDINLSYYLDTAADDNFSGYLHLFEPSSTVHVKHFIMTGNTVKGLTNMASNNTFVAGYLNTTSAVDAIQFKMSSGNTDVGDVCLYGLTI